MEELFAGAIELQAARSAELGRQAGMLYKCASAGTRGRPNAAKLLRFLGEYPIDRLYELCCEFSNRTLATHYRAELLHAESAIPAVATDSPFCATSNALHERATRLETFQTGRLQRHMQILGLQQARFRYAHILSILVQLQQASHMLARSSASRTVLEQKYYFQEFIHITKTLRIDVLRDRALYDDTRGIQDAMLVADMKSQIIQNVNYTHHQQLFVKCFGYEKYHEVLIRAGIEFMLQQHTFYSQIDINDLQDIDMIEVLSNAIKVITIFACAIENKPLDEQHSGCSSQISLQTYCSENTTEEFSDPKLQQLAELFCQHLDQIIIYLYQYYKFVTTYYLNVKTITVLWSQRIIILMAKFQLQIEFFINKIKEYVVLQPKNIQLLYQNINQFIQQIIQYSINKYQKELKMMFLDSTFDNWVSISKADKAYQQIIMRENRIISHDIDSQNIWKLIVQLDENKRTKILSDQQQLIVFDYLYCFDNLEKEDIVETLSSNINYFPYKDECVLEIGNIQFIPHYFYRAISQINQFTRFIQIYKSEFNVRLIVGSTVNCLQHLLRPPNVRPKEKTPPFILDECLMISQIKLVNVFSELLDYEKRVFSFYLKVQYDDLTTLVRQPINTIFEYQINFKSILRPHHEYHQTGTVTAMCKNIFERFLYINKIMTSFNSIRKIFMQQLFRHLEINLLDHYSYLHYDFQVMDVVQEEVQFMQQTFKGMFNMEAFECIIDFIQLPVQPAVKYQEFIMRYRRMFDTIRFKELMMRMAGQCLVRAYYQEVRDTVQKIEIY